MLINPIWKHTNSVPPLGLAYLGAVLEKAGIEVGTTSIAIVDAGPAKKELTELGAKLLELKGAKKE